MNINKLLYDPEYFGITKYEWRADGKLDTFDAIDLSNRELDSLPFSFGKIKGLFNSSKNLLDESSIPDFPESCKQFFLSGNKFKNLNGFHTKTDELRLFSNSLESIEGIKNLKFRILNLTGCDKIKDWDSLPFVEEYLDLADSSIKSLDCLKNKKLIGLRIRGTKVMSIEGLVVNNLFIEQTGISTLKDIAKCPTELICNKDKEYQFINELKEMFPTSFNLKQVNWKSI